MPPTPKQLELPGDDAKGRVSIDDKKAATERVIDRDANRVEDRTCDRSEVSQSIFAGGSTRSKGFPGPFASLVILATSIKVLLIPSYHSTDFEVHRNWLAITWSLPPREWYFDMTSPWTLDYPPLFAWFERALAPFAASATLGGDPNMVRIDALDYASDRCKMFMRSSVIIADLVLVAGVWLMCTSHRPNDAPIAPAARNHMGASALVLLNGGLLLVDHVHFQYNGFLFGVLLISMAALRRHGNFAASSVRTPAGSAMKWALAGGAAFAALLGLKHLFLPLAPIFFLHLLFGFCFTNDAHSPRKQPSDPRRHAGVTFSWMRFALLGSLVLLVLLLPFAPILYSEARYQQRAAGTSSGFVAPRSSISSSSEGSWDLDWHGAAARQLPQIFGRLFPFARGAAVSDECSAFSACEPASSSSSSSSWDAWIPYLSFFATGGAAPSPSSSSSSCTRPRPNSCHERGLLHAYWAPNAWAIYAFADRVLKRLLGHGPTATLGDDDTSLPSPTSGLVGKATMSVLPDVTPAAAALLTMVAMLPALTATATTSYAAVSVRSPFESEDTGGRGAVVVARRERASRVFERSIAHSALSAFMFGWHVHEKVH